MQPRHPPPGCNHQNNPGQGHIPVIFQELGNEKPYVTVGTHQWKDGGGWSFVYKVKEFRIYKIGKDGKRIYDKKRYGDPSLNTGFVFEPAGQQEENKNDIGEGNGGYIKTNSDNEQSHNLQNRQVLKIWGIE